MSEKNSDTPPNNLIVPYTSLSELALTGIIDEYISRDSSFQDGTLQVKRERVLQGLKNNELLITYSVREQSTNIRTRLEMSEHL